MVYLNSLEYKSEHIYHAQTREYFEEVLSSYQNGNYRSAVVMLYSVVICDLIYKLQELINVYSDSDAESILEEVKREQEESTIKSQWEVTLIKKVKENTNIFSQEDMINIDYLREQRHLAAHPVLDQLDILTKPNKETVRSLMTNMLDGLLCKSPLISGKLIGFFLTDLNERKNELTDQSDFERYISKRYYNKLNTVTSQKLFRSLWKIVFNLDNDDTRENRWINFRAIRLLYEQEKSLFNEQIKKESSYYSNVNANSNETLSYTCMFFSLFPELYNLMEESTKIIIKNKAEEDLELYQKSVFLSSNIEEHIEALKNNIEDEDYLHEQTKGLLSHLAEKYGCMDYYLDFIIKLFENSLNFNNADRNFTNYIESYIDSFNMDHFESIINAININNQLYKRGRARFDNIQLVEWIENKYPDKIDYTQYTNFEYHTE